MTSCMQNQLPGLCNGLRVEVLCHLIEKTLQLRGACLATFRLESQEICQKPPKKPHLNGGLLVKLRQRPPWPRFPQGARRGRPTHRKLSGNERKRAKINENARKERNKRSRLQRKRTGNSPSRRASLRPSSRPLPSPPLSAPDDAPRSSDSASRSPPCRPRAPARRHGSPSPRPPRRRAGAP